MRLQRQPDVLQRAYGRRDGSLEPRLRQQRGRVEESLGGMLLCALSMCPSVVFDSSPCVVSFSMFVFNLRVQSASPKLPVTTGTRTKHKIQKAFECLFDITLGFLKLLGNRNKYCTAISFCRSHRSVRNSGDTRVCCASTVPSKLCKMSAV